MGGSRGVEHGGQGEEIKEPLMGNLPNTCATNSSSSGEGESIWVVFLSTFVAICGSFEFGSCTGYSAPAQSGIRNDLGLSLAEFSVFGSILPIGAMIGAITSGRIADFIGRKGAMGVSAVICIAGWLAVYFAQGVVPLDVGRFCTGYGTGVFSYVVPVFIAEITPKNLRGGLTTVNQLMICTGVSVTYILGNLMSWRMLALTGLVPCVILLVGLFFIPESPRWLAKVNRQKEFEVALRWLRGKNADISIEASEIRDFIEMLERIPKPKVLDLFQKRYARSVIVGVALMVFQQFDGINGIVFYASETFVTAGFKSGELGTILMALVPPPVTLLGAILMDKTGRRPLLMMSASGTCLGCILAGAGLFLKGHQIFLNLVPAMVLTGVLLFAGSFALGMGPIPWVMMSEIFPINIKGMAGSLVTLVNWFGSWAVSLTFNFLMGWSTPGTFLLYAAVCGITVLFVVKVVPETKGRTLEEIQSDMNS